MLCSECIKILSYHFFSYFRPMEEMSFNGVEKIYKGKVRNVYYFKNNYILLEASNRISAFDVILPKEIPYKGQVLHQLSTFMLQKTAHICQNWLKKSINPTIGIGIACTPIKIEVVVRGYLVGHAWRTYQSGARVLCGNILPEGLQENAPFATPIITPTTKASEGHDEDIAEQELLEQQFITPERWNEIKEKALALYNYGAEYAASRGLILVDTKYEFGIHNNELYLMDEIHTPDSSRYFYAKDYEQKLANNEKQLQLSKEFVREWLLENNFSGKEGQQIPEMTPEIVNNISNRYIQLYELVTGVPFEKTDPPKTTIINEVNNYLKLVL
jgi:phosphoribosylaminoimidazole-succinocarboxamide synthase